MHISLPSCVVEAQHNNMIKVKLFQFNCFSLASSHFLADDCHAWMSLQYFPFLTCILVKSLSGLILTDFSLTFQADIVFVSFLPPLLTLSRVKQKDQIIHEPMNSYDAVYLHFNDFWSCFGWSTLWSSYSDWTARSPSYVTVRFRTLLPPLAPRRRRHHLPCLHIGEQSREIWRHQLNP